MRARPGQRGGRSARALPRYGRARRPEGSLTRSASHVNSSPLCVRAAYGQGSRGGRRLDIGATPLRHWRTLTGGGAPDRPSRVVPCPCIHSRRASQEWVNRLARLRNVGGHPGSGRRSRKATWQFRRNIRLCSLADRSVQIRRRRLPAGLGVPGTRNRVSGGPESSVVGRHASHRTCSQSPSKREGKWRCRPRRR